MRILLISFLLLFITTASSFSLRVEEKLPQTQEERAISLFLKVRCLVCNGQVIENSDADFAFEMRKLIRKKIKSGQSNEEIKQYLTNNFGEEILTELDNKNSKIILWLLPIIFSTMFLLILLNSINRFSKKK